MATLLGQRFPNENINRAEERGRARLTFCQSIREEEANLLANCAPQLKPPVVTALHTGFRASELLSLTWQDVDFGRGVVTVRAGYAKNGEGRSVPLNETLTMVLKSAKVSETNAERVFGNGHAQPYRSSRTAFERAVRLAGITDF